MRYTQAVQLEEHHRRLVDQLMRIENIDTKLQDPVTAQHIMKSINGFSVEKSDHAPV
jgi:hypothetical protein